MSSFDLQQVPRLRRGFRFQFEPVQGCHVLLYPEGMIKLNDSAGAIARLIDGQRSVATIIERLNAQYPDAPELAEDVVQFMEVAREKFWLQLD